MTPLTAREVEIHLDGRFSIIASVTDDGGWLVHDIVLYDAEAQICSAIPWSCLAFETRSLESIVVEHCNAHAAEWGDEDRLAPREMYAALSDHGGEIE